MSDVEVVNAEATEAPAEPNLPSLETVRGKLTELATDLTSKVEARREKLKGEVTKLVEEHTTKLKEAKVALRNKSNEDIKDLRKASAQASRKWKQLLATLEADAAAKAEPAPAAETEEPAAFFDPVFLG